MRIAIAVTGLAALSLAACNDAETVADTGDPESVAAASAELPNPEPGQYRSVGELVKFEVADVPPEQVEMVRGMMGEVFAREQLQCITRVDDSFDTQIIEAVRFVPLVPGNII